MKVTDQESLSDGRAALAKMMTVHWITAHGKQILFAITAIAILLTFLLPLSRRFSGSAKSDYLQADAAFSNWVSQQKHDHALFKQVSDPLKRHPELSAKFGALIAQRLLTLGEHNLAYEYAQEALTRTKALLSPYHCLYSQNTLLISQGQLSEALQSAYQLKNNMASDDSLWSVDSRGLRSGRTLYAYNLLRIASLEREMGAKDKEMQAWNEILNNAGLESATVHPKTFDPEAFKMLSENFQSGDVSLVDYIAERKQLLKDL